MTAKEKILEAADVLFGKEGFDAATTREIAQRSGVNKALIHYHFQSKEDLLVAVLERYYENLTDTLTQTVLADGTVNERLFRLIDSYMDFLAENRNFARIVQREASGGRNMNRIREIMTPLFELGVNLLNENYPNAKGSDLTAEHLLSSFYGMIVGYFSFSGVLVDLYKSDPLSKENLEGRKAHIHKMVEIVLQSLEGDVKK